MLHEKESNSNNIAIHNRKHNQQQQQQEEQKEEQEALKNALGRRCSCHALAFCGGDCIYPMLMEGSR
jgi:radical SAM protein with 4Fe4S-binding SPASM domain